MTLTQSLDQTDISPVSKKGYSDYFRKKCESLISGKQSNWKFIVNLIIGKSRKYAPHNSKVLDVGCGVGSLLICMRLFGYKCFGIDFDKTQIETAKEISNDYNAGDIMYSQSNMSNFPFESNMFDITTSKDVVEHLPDNVLSEYLNESYRVLKDKGVLIISTKPTKFSYLFSRKRLFFILPFFFLPNEKITKIFKKIDHYLPPLYEKIRGRPMRDTHLEPAPGHCNCPEYRTLLNKVKEFNFEIIESHSFIRPEQNWFKLIRRLFKTEQLNPNILIIARKV